MTLFSRSEIPIGMTMGGRIDYSNVPEMYAPNLEYTVEGASGHQFAYSASRYYIELKSLTDSSKYLMYGKVEDAKLSWVIYTRDPDNNYIQHPDLNGSEFYRAAFTYLSKIRGLNISTIVGLWQEGSNYEKYLANLRSGMDVVSSARETWAARMAAEHGYSEIRIPYGDDAMGYNYDMGGYTFYFKKP